MKKLTLAGLLFLSNMALAQDFQVLNPNYTLLRLNPAFAGSNGGFRFQGTMLFQPEEQFCYTGVDWYSKKLKAGFSVAGSSYSYKHGILRDDYFSIGYSQHILCRNDNFKVIPSLQLAYIQKSLDVNALTFSEMTDPRNGIIWQNFTTNPQPRKYAMDINSGLLIQYKSTVTAGLSLYHINGPDVGLIGASKLPTRMTVHGSYTLRLSEKSIAHFLGVFYHQGKHDAGNMVCTLVLNHFVMGISASTSSASSLMLGLRADFLTLSASYGYNFSGETVPKRIMQFNLSVNLRNKHLRKSLNAIENW